MGDRGLDVVYVNHRSAGLLEPSVARLRDCARLDHVDLRVTIVDNASGAADEAVLARQARHAALVRFPDNRGFSAACNAGAACGEAARLLFLNPDTLPHEGLLAGLCDALDRHRGRAVVGPRHYLDAARSCSIGPLRGQSLLGDVADLLDDRGWLGQRSLRLLRRRMQAFASTTAVAVRALSGAALAIGRAAFTELGGFDPGYFLYAEDTDLCVRARAHRMAVQYLPWLAVTHFVEQSGGQSSPRARDARRESAARFLRRRYRWPGRAFRELLLAGAPLLPRLRDRAAAPAVDPRSPRLRPGRAGARAVLELGRSPLFDNGATLTFDGPQAALPAEVIERLPPGRFYLRTASERHDRHWQEHELVSFTIEAGQERAR